MQMPGGKVNPHAGQGKFLPCWHMAQLARIKLNYSPQLLFQVPLSDTQLEQLPPMMYVCARVCFYGGHGFKLGGFSIGFHCIFLRSGCLLESGTFWLVWVARECVGFYCLSPSTEVTGTLHLTGIHSGAGDPNFTCRAQICSPDLFFQMHVPFPCPS